ncbi:MAG: histidinol dehydrogenase [Acidimicrobiales bacterium]
MDDFLKHVHVVSIDQPALTEVAEHVIALATYEGLDAHAESIRRRQP